MAWKAKWDKEQRENLKPDQTLFLFAIFDPKDGRAEQYGPINGALSWRIWKFVQIMYRGEKSPQEALTEAFAGYDWQPKKKPKPKAAAKSR